MPQAQYAVVVQKNGFYLGLLDLAVLCHSYGKQGIVIFREKDLQLQVQPLEKLIERSLQVSGLALPEGWLCPPDAEQWHFLSVRCDYQPAHHGECNHWLPVWTQEQLGTDFEVNQHSQMTDLHSAIYAYTEKVQASTVNAEDSQDEDGHGDAELDTLLEQIGQLERQAECYQDLFAAGFCPQEVPADGNCGLWSVMSLRQGGCLGNAKEAAAQMKQERIALGRAWSQCSGNILWQQLWKYFGMESELTPEEISKAAQAKTQARAQATPAKTPPQNSKSKSKSACLDEMSPMKHLDPKKISECKPANPSSLLTWCCDSLDRRQTSRSARRRTSLVNPKMLLR